MELPTQGRCQFLHLELTPQADSAIRISCNLAFRARKQPVRVGFYDVHPAKPGCQGGLGHNDKPCWELSYLDRGWWMRLVLLCPCHINFLANFFAIPMLVVLQLCCNANFQGAGFDPRIS